MGCLKNILRAILLTLAIVGFLSLGGKELVTGLVNNYFNPSKDTMLERAQKVGDFSHINDEFEIEKAAGIMGYNAVVAEHKASGQKMLIVDSGKKPLLTPEDIKGQEVETKLKDLSEKFKYQAITVQDIKVTSRGTMKVYGKQVPYAKFDAHVTKLPFSDISGVVASVKTSDGSEKLALSLSEKKKYSQLITNEFYRGVQEVSN